MCGIVGFSGARDDQRLQAMMRAISYRGPDGCGAYHSAGINFGHQRLSIIDVAGGVQPMTDHRGEVTIVFNGEIYNFLALRQKYLSDQPLKTNSDTEVLLYLYRELGERCVEELDGMFAFAIWDSRDQTLFLARDRMGEKPLYVAQHAGELLFASEPKALLAAGITPGVDVKTLPLYLLLGYTPGTHTFFKGITKILPGYCATWRGNRLTTCQYWKPTFQVSAEPSAEKLRQLVCAAVGSQMVADVPLGVFLSGGLDSSTIAWCAAQSRSASLHTFSIGFSDKSFDESRYARQVAKHLGTTHHEKIFSEQDLLTDVQTVLEKLDEPFADPSIFPTHLLARFARDHVTVALGGDGSDELFGGYPTFQAHRVANAIGWIPTAIISTLAGILPTSDRYMSLDFKLKRFARGSDQRSYWRDILWMSPWSATEQKSLLIQPELLNDLSGRVDQLFCNTTDTPVGSIHRFWQQGYLVDDILHKLDRATMYASLEGRSPFLNRNVVEYVNALPQNAKQRGWQTKYLLKQAMASRLPAEIINRRKKGFGVPLTRWLRGPLKEFMMSVLDPASLREVGLFQPDVVGRYIREHVEGRADHRLALWNLMCFVRWHQQWVRK